MKKITLIASIAMACAISQATNVNWGMTTGDTVDTKFANGTAYLLYNSNTSEVFSYDGDLATATSFSSSNFKDTVWDSTTVGLDGSFRVDGKSLTPESTGLTKGNKAAYMVIISADGKNMLAMDATGSINIQVSELQQNMLRDASAFQSYSAAGPGPGPDPVPEPTSLALIALGVAAFGLKRKHA